MANVGFATLSVIPSFSGFQRNLDRGTGAAMSAAGARGGEQFGRSFSSRFATVLRRGAFFGGLGAAFGVTAFIKDSVTLEAEYGKTMAQMRVATGVTGKELQRLDDLAIKLGKETVFSANEASSAMLELAKNGIKPATIEAGALQSALTLATAGDVDLTTAAQTMGNALNAFSLKGRRASQVASALAGAANASSASVGSLAEGLQQSAATAADVGFNIQETTGTLAAFANAGISGSDAGTSLKTMLSRLVPQTNKAKKAMELYGLSFVKANGDFASATEIAEELKQGLGDLSASERSAALNTIFGSDARRAATILTKEGADGLRDYIRATSDQQAAEDLAKAKMEGTAGAIERLRGSWETAKLEFGKSIAPVAADFLDFLSGQLDTLNPKLTKFGTWFTETGAPAIKRVADQAENAAGKVKALMDAFNDLPGWAKKVLLVGAGGGLAAGKLGLGRVLTGGGSGIFSKGSTPIRPLYVFVTNPGFGGPGGGGGLGGLGGRSLLLKAGTVTLQGAVITAAVIAVANASRIEKKQAPGIASSFITGPHVTGGQSEADKLGDPNFFSDKLNRELEAQARGVDKVRTTWIHTKEAAEDYSKFVQQRVPREIHTTVTGWDVANRDARNYLATLLEIRSLHMDARLAGAGGSGTAPGSGFAPGSNGGGGGGKGGDDRFRPSSRGINITVEKVEAQDVNHLLRDLQGRAHRASLDGIRG